MEEMFSVLKRAVLPCPQSAVNICSIFVKLGNLYVFFPLSQQHKALQFLKHLRRVKEVMKGIYCLPRNKGRRDVVQRTPGEGLHPARTQKLWIAQVTCNPFYFSLIITWCPCPEPASKVIVSYQPAHSSQSKLQNKLQVQFYQNYQIFKKNCCKSLATFY